jgi:hypothetical protein
MWRADLLALLLVAHGLHVAEGTVYVGGGSVVTTLEVEATGASPLDELVLRDGEGARVPGRIAVTAAASTPGHVVVTLEHALPSDARWLAFQLEPHEPATARARRLVLDVTGEGVGRPAVVDLTSGGNVEVLRLGPASLAGEIEGLHEVRTLVRDEDGGTRLDVVMPLGVLESFAPLKRAEVDFISVEEQEAARVLLAAAGADEVAFLGLDDAAMGPAPPPRRLGAWTARVRVGKRGLTPFSPRPASEPAAEATRGVVR